MQLNTYFPDGLSGAPYFSHIYQNVNWLNRCVKAGQILLDRTSVNSLLVSMWYWYFVTDNVSFHVKCLGLYILYWYCCNWQLSSNLWLLSTCMPMLRTVWISVFLFGQEYEMRTAPPPPVIQCEVGVSHLHVTESTPPVIYFKAPSVIYTAAAAFVDV